MNNKVESSCCCGAQMRISPEVSDFHIVTVSGQFFHVHNKCSKRYWKERARTRLASGQIIAPQGSPDEQ